jgi:monofunctional glycosyltransferase
MRQRVVRRRGARRRAGDPPEWVPLERISPRLRRAVIVAEDGRFYDHDGIDWGALREEFRYRGDDDFSILDAADRRALLESLRYYRANRDGSAAAAPSRSSSPRTCTTRRTARSCGRLEEFVVARRLERFLDKDRILELYLNVVEWGPGIFGVEAARATTSTVPPPT